MHFLPHFSQRKIRMYHFNFLLFFGNFFNRVAKISACKKITVLSQLTECVPNLSHPKIDPNSLCQNYCVPINVLDQRIHNVIIRHTTTYVFH